MSEGECAIMLLGFVGLTIGIAIWMCKVNKGNHPHL